MTRADDGRRIWSCRGAAALLAVLGATGCGARGPALVPVSGSVTFDGTPVETGEILFRAADGAVASHAGPIAAGRYEARVSPGAKRVEIIATRPAAKVVEKPGGSGESAPAEMYVPDRYNAQSTLTADVTAPGPNVFDFTLTGAAPVTAVPRRGRVERATGMAVEENPLASWVGWSSDSESLAGNPSPERERWDTGNAPDSVLHAERSTAPEGLSGHRRSDAWWVGWLFRPGVPSLALRAWMGTTALTHDHDARVASPRHSKSDR